MSATVLITGNTFPHKDALRAMGGKWDAKATGWKVPAAKAAEARALVNGGSGYQINGTGETFATVAAALAEVGRRVSASSPALVGHEVGADAITLSWRSGATSRLTLEWGSDGDAAVVSPDGATVAIIAPPPKPMKARMSEEERERRIVERNYRRSGDYYGSGKFDLDENP
jgi:hypothetical protein